MNETQQGGCQCGAVADYLPGMIDLTVGSFDHPAALPPLE